MSVGLFRKLPYDVQKDFAPISTLGSFDLGLFVAERYRQEGVEVVSNESIAAFQRQGEAIDRESNDLAGMPLVVQ